MIRAMNFCSKGCKKRAIRCAASNGKNVVGRFDSWRSQEPRKECSIGQDVFTFLIDSTETQTDESNTFIDFVAEMNNIL